MTVHEPRHCELVLRFEVLPDDSINYMNEPLYCLQHSSKNPKCVLQRFHITFSPVRNAFEFKLRLDVNKER